MRLHVLQTPVICYIIFKMGFSCVPHVCYREREREKIHYCLTIVIFMLAVIACTIIILPFHRIQWFKYINTQRTQILRITWTDQHFFIRVWYDFIYNKYWTRLPGTFSTLYACKISVFQNETENFTYALQNKAVEMYEENVHFSFHFVLMQFLEERIFSKRKKKRRKIK